MSSDRFVGKTAIVTGASLCSGRAIALALHREGAQVVCADSVGAEEGVHKYINECGGKAIFVTMNVTKAADVKRLVEEAVKEFGRVDILVNNAGNGGGSKGRWDADVAINARGGTLCGKYVSAQMRKQEPLGSIGRGCIINITGKCLLESKCLIHKTIIRTVTWFVRGHFRRYDIPFIEIYHTCAADDLLIQPLLLENNEAQEKLANPTIDAAAP